MIRITCDRCGKLIEHFKHYAITTYPYNSGGEEFKKQFCPDCAKKFGEMFNNLITTNTEDKNG